MTLVYAQEISDGVLHLMEAIQMSRAMHTCIHLAWNFPEGNLHLIKAVFAINFIALEVNTIIFMLDH